MASAGERKYPNDHFRFTALAVRARLLSLSCTTRTLIDASILITPIGKQTMTGIRKHKLNWVDWVGGFWECVVGFRLTHDALLRGSCSKSLGTREISR